MNAGNPALQRYIRFVESPLRLHSFRNVEAFDKNAVGAPGCIEDRLIGEIDISLGDRTILCWLDGEFRTMAA